MMERMNAHQDQPVLVKVLDYKLFGNWLAGDVRHEYNGKRGCCWVELSGHLDGWFVQQVRSMTPVLLPEVSIVWGELFDGPAIIAMSRHSETPPWVVSANPSA